MNADRAGALLVQTPEGVTFALSLAGPVTRCLAWGIDFGCILAASWLVGAALGLLGLVSADLAQALAIVAYFAISIGYGITAEWCWRGQTIGKRVLRLRVMDAQGLRLQLSQIVIRNLLRFVDMLPALYLLGGLACLLSPRAQRLGDLAANTVVVRSPKTVEPDLDQLLAGKFNSLRAHPHLAARLRQRVSAEEARVALQALVRRDEFEPVARVELFGEIADHFRELVEFPAEAVEGLTDEQYVRNVADILFRTREDGVTMRQRAANRAQLEV